MIVLLASAALHFSAANTDVSATPLKCTAVSGDYTMIPVQKSGNQIRYVEERGAITISGRLHLLNTENNRKWLPAGGAVFELDDTHRIAGLQVYVEPGRPNYLKIGIRRPFSKQPTPIASAPRESWIDFTVKMTPDEALEVWVNKDYRKFSAKGHRPAQAFGMCSSGSFEFSFKS